MTEPFFYLKKRTTKNSSTGESIKCWECNSAINPKCRDTFDESLFAVQDCPARSSSYASIGVCRKEIYKSQCVLLGRCLRRFLDEEINFSHFILRRRRKDGNPTKLRGRKVGRQVGAGRQRKWVREGRVGTVRVERILFVQSGRLQSGLHFASPSAVVHLDSNAVLGGQQSDPSTVGTVMTTTQSQPTCPKHGPFGGKYAAEGVFFACDRTLVENKLKSFHFSLSYLLFFTINFLCQPERA